MQTTYVYFSYLQFNFKFCNSQNIYLSALLLAILWLYYTWQYNIHKIQCRLLNLYTFQHLLFLPYFTKICVNLNKNFFWRIYTIFFFILNWNSIQNFSVIDYTSDWMNERFYFVVLQSFNFFLYVVINKLQ